MKNLRIVKEHIIEHSFVVNSLDETQIKTIVTMADNISNSLKKNGTIFWCGNGGSASDSQHLSAELIGRFKKSRKPLKSISLSSNVAALTCIANDFGYENIFSRQIDALGKKQDILVLLSTSGNSKNILKVLDHAKKKGMKTICFLGYNGGKCKGKSSFELIIKSKSTARIQEMHIMIGQIICDLIERNLKL